MPGPLSDDLRRRVVEAVEEGATYEETAERFGVGLASISRWMRRKRDTGAVSPKQMGGRRFGLDAEDLEVVRGLVEEKPDRTIKELTDAFRTKRGKKVSTAAISRALSKLKLTRKKKRLRAKERKSERVAKLRELFLGRQPTLDISRLIFIDETGTNIAMTRRFARAPRGDQVEDHVPRNRGTVLTVIGALTLDGLEAVMTVEGGTTGEVFLAYVHNLLKPLLMPGDIVILDNLGAHRDQRVRAAIKAAGATLMFLPPYSPELNPIEECWSKVKNLLRTAKARSLEALNKALGTAMKLVTTADADGWFRHAGYTFST